MAKGRQDPDFYFTQMDKCREKDNIPVEMYAKYDVKKGLREKDGKGVITGITNVSKVQGFDIIDGVRTPIDGRLFYRGYDIRDIIANKDPKYGFETIAYLLLFGELPTDEELKAFIEEIIECRELPNGFIRDVILRQHQGDVMNTMSMGVLSLATYDDITNQTMERILHRCMKIISVMPRLAIYGYESYDFYDNHNSLIIHRADNSLSVSENILRMLRHDTKFTPLEAEVLDAALILHMEHGGGNNSAFTTRVVTSAGSDSYSVFAAALSSLKGPKHGGANIKVVQMIRDIKKNVKDLNDEKELEEYLVKILDKKAFDKMGLIYGMGHAVYSLSDPRAMILKEYAKRLAKEKGREEDLKLYQFIEDRTPALICARRNAFTGVSANVDLYSGFIYDMLGLPEQMYTPMFAIARIVGWSAHHIEELVNSGKIIRPAYVSAVTPREYPKQQ